MDMEQHHPGSGGRRGFDRKKKRRYIEANLARRQERKERGKKMVERKYSTKYDSKSEGATKRQKKSGKGGGRQWKEKENKDKIGYEAPRTKATKKTKAENEAPGGGAGRQT